MRRSTYPLLVLLAVAVLALFSCGGKNAAKTVTVPRFSSPQNSTLSLEVAYDRLHEAGLRVAIRHGFSIQSNNATLSSLPDPRQGSIVPRGSVVTIAVGPVFMGSMAVLVTKPPPLKIPDFAGKPPTSATGWANSHHLYWRVDHLPALPASNRPHLLDNYVVTGQSPIAGTTVRSWGTWISLRVALRPAG